MGALLAQHHGGPFANLVRPDPYDAPANWVAVGVARRVSFLRSARHRIATNAEAFCAAISPALPRTSADTLTAEVWPLLEACRYVERNAERLLSPQRLRSKGRPWWLGGVDAEIYREPLGEILVLAPANFPLFLPGVQALQALAAGNSVVWKPAPGGGAVARLFAETLRAAGLPEGLLRVTDESIEAARKALDAQPAKVIFTGSHATGSAVLSKLAESATPAVMELSGADAAIVMPGADLSLAARAIAFGLRLNGAQVCMSPRRLFAEPDTMRALVPLLQQELAPVPAVPLRDAIAAQLQDLVSEAAAQGAEVLGEVAPAAQRPLLLRDARPGMRIAQSDVFAPVLSLLELPFASLLEAYNECSYALTASIFCARADEGKARILAGGLRAGTVLINDLIAPTADPRVPFSGRGASGFGATRGAEGLLEMTAPKVLLVRRSGRLRHLEPGGEADAPLLANLIRVTHAGTWRERWNALQQVARLGRKRKTATGPQQTKEQA